MDHGADALRLQPLLQPVAVVAEDGENVIHVVGPMVFRQTDMPVADVLLVVFRYRFAPAVLLVQIVEFDGKHSRLQFVHAAVHPLVGEHIFPTAAIVGQGTDGGGQFPVGCGHGSGIAQCPKVLARVETVGCCVAECPCVPPPMSASVGLCIVFYQLQTVAFTNLPYSFGIGATPVEMHQQHGLGALRDAVGYQPVVYL